MYSGFETKLKNEDMHNGQKSAICNMSAKFNKSFEKYCNRSLIIISAFWNKLNPQIQKRNIKKKQKKQKPRLNRCPQLEPYLMPGWEPVCWLVIGIPLRENEEIGKCSFHVFNRNEIHIQAFEDAVESKRIIFRSSSSTFHIFKILTFQISKFQNYKH